MKLLSLLKSWFIEYLTPSPRYPSHARMQQLHDGEGEPITRAEWNLGAHYCPEFDYMFTFGERPEGGCYCRSSIGEYRATHKDHCLATHPANYEPCEHEFEPEPHGSRDTFVPPPIKCNNDPDLVDYEYEPTPEKIKDLLVKAKAFVASHEYKSEPLTTFVPPREETEFTIFGCGIDGKVEATYDQNVKSLDEAFRLAYKYAYTCSAVSVEIYRTCPTDVRVWEHVGSVGNYQINNV